MWERACSRWRASNPPQIQHPETIKQPIGCLLNCSRYVYVTVMLATPVAFLHGNMPSRYSPTHF
ncbi:putative metal-binding protein [Pseudomonas sp. BE134]|nr:putative metal-binding protein [Pseudomonas sp. BE134]